ncbi:response regulator transcription factor [Enterococcus sp. LJL120]
MKPNILLIEDDLVITDFMQVVLEKEGYQLATTADGMSGLNYFQGHEVDLILLDLGLPDIDGSELLKIIRKQSQVPVIIISARDNEQGKVDALDLGADDYVTKPFGTRELLARIRTALRHKNFQAQAEPIITNGALRLDIPRHQLFKGETEIHLTKNEYRIVKVLFENLGKVVTYKTLMTAVWGPYTGDQQVLRVNLSNIRKKIESNPLEPEYLFTEIGVGYRLKDWR